ncbi:site-specific integrase [Enterobacter kobei]
MIVLMKNCGLRLDEMLTLPSSLFTEEYLASVPVSELTIRGLHIGPRCGVHTKFGMTRELFITRRLYEQVLDYLADEEYEKKIQKWRARQGGEGRHEPLFLMANGKRMSEKAFTPAGTVFAIARPGLLREMCSDINPMICGQRLRPIFYARH